MLIKSYYLDRARLMDFFQVMSITADFLKKEDLAALQLTEVAAEFNAAFTALDTALKQAQKTGYTERVIAADDERDNILAGMLGALRSMLRFPDKETAAAAAQLSVVTDKYGAGVARLPQREETAALTNMVQDLRAAANAPLTEKTGLKPWIDKLDESNRAFDALYTHRTEKETEFITGLTRTERARMQAAFEKLTRAIEAHAFINGDATYKPLADKINTTVGNVQTAVKARATARAKNISPDKV